MKLGKITLTMAFIGMLTAVTLPLGASGKQGNDQSGAEMSKGEIQQSVEEILSGYESDSLTEDIAREIHDKFREAGLRGGPQLDEVISSVGFDPELLRQLAPPPSDIERNESGNDRNNGQEDDKGLKYSVAQAISDNAQLHTIAFNALAFFTGDSSADTFFPPGKVSDFFSFQYFRDVDDGGLGHNTTFVPRIANNVFLVLNENQIAKLKVLAETQANLLTEYGYGRYPLMEAFRRNMDGDLPAGKSGLDENTVVEYSANLYGIDGLLSYNRAKVLGEIIHSLDSEQRVRFDEMAAGSSATWGFPKDQVDKRSMSHTQHVLMMTYASEMFTWYAGDIESDTYFCPERHGTYYGGFYMKDAPAMNNPDYSIGTNITGDSGAALLNILTSEQAEKITAIIDLQRTDLEEMTEVRRTISTKLRQFMEGTSVNEDEIMELMARYGELDGKINYLYATTFADIYQDLNKSQLNDLMELRQLDGFEPADAYLFAEPVSYPDNLSTDKFFK